MNYVKLFYFIFLFPIVSFPQSENKQISFRDLTVDQGLSQNSVVSIAQDSIGYIWFNTQDGLNKYDGREMTHYSVYSKGTKRQAKYITGELFVDRLGKLWVVANSGKLNQYHQEQDRFHEISRFDEVITMTQDSELNYYIGTYGQGLYKIDYKTKDTLQILKAKDKHFAICSFLETDGKTILATTDNGIIEIKNGNYEFIELAPETIFSRFAKSRSGTIFLGSYEKGLYLKANSDSNFNPFTGFEKYPLPTNIIVKDLLVDKRDWLWITTERQGVYLVDFRSKTIRNFRFEKNNPYALRSNSLFFLYEDDAGTIWIGTEGAGVCFYDEYLTKFNVLTDEQVPQNVHIDVVRAITTDAKNTIWIGTENKSLTKIDTHNQQFITYTAANSNLRGDRIVSLYYDEGNLWIGHLNQGLQLMDASGKMKYFEETASFTVLKIYKDASGQMWLCTNKGLIQFDKNKGIEKQFASNNSSLTSNYYISTIEQDINTIVQGDANTLWVGTEFDGLYKLEIKQNKFTPIDGISDRIYSLHYDESKLYIGTNGGGLKLYDINKGTIATFSKKDGLPNDIIYGILPDYDGNLWLSSNKGITKLKIENDSISTIKNYSNYFGLQSYEFNAGAYHRDANGTMYFGGIKGINWFNPKQLQTNPVPPKTALTKLQVFNNEIPFSKDLQLLHDENTLSFTFSSLQFSQPELNQYKYRLVNNDGDWIEAGYNNVAHYTNLPPNDYEFQVVSSNYDGIWNTSPVVYSFTILKPWYFSITAKIIYGMLFLLAIYGIYKYLKWRWYMRMKLEMETRETERWKQLDEYKTKLYNNISHEFRTPLTLISGPVENQLTKSNISENDKVELNLIKRNSKRLLNLVNQLLDLSKLETGNLKLSVSEGNLSVLLKQLATAFEFKGKEKNINFTYEIANMEHVWFDKDVIEKIVSNLLHNAVKYAPVDGYIVFKASVNDGHVTISVINNGNTLNDEELPKLFQRYYQNDTHSEGVGIGLSLVKELSVLCHGNVVAHTMNRDDIQFVVTLPIEKSYFNTLEISDERRIHSEGELPELQSEAEQNPTLQAKAANEKPLVLIVEDDEDIRMFVGSILKDSYKIMEASNGEIGVSKAIQYIPDIIVSDVMMPVMDGIGLCNTLKEDFRTSHIPIILLTAKSGDANEIEGLKTGADAYLTKPFNSEKLKIRIENLIGTRQKLQKYYGKNNVLEFHDVKVSKIDEQFFNNLKEAIKENIVQPDFTSEQLSSLMLMSRMQLHRKLKALIGLTTSEFIRNERLKLAITLLEKSDATISEVAYQTGFNSPSYFIKCFKQVYNRTPKEYLTSIVK